MQTEQRKQLDAEWQACVAVSMKDGAEAFWNSMARAAEIERQIAADEKA